MTGGETLIDHTSAICCITASYSDTSAKDQLTGRRVPQDCSLYQQRCVNHRSQKSKFLGKFTPSVCSTSPFLCKSVRLHMLTIM